MRSHDRDTVICLRHALQTCESSKRQAWRALDIFRAHLVTTGQEVSIVPMAELLSELAAIRLLLSGTREGGAS